MNNVEQEITGEGETFAEACEDAIRRRHQGFEESGLTPEARPVRVIRIELEPNVQNQWVKTYRVVVPGT